MIEAQADLGEFRNDPSSLRHPFQSCRFPLYFFENLKGVRDIVAGNKLDDRLKILACWMSPLNFKFLPSWHSRFSAS